MTIVEHKACRVCGGSLMEILSLGSHYLSEFLLPGESDGIKAPLELVLCETCHLLQLKHTAPADAMYQNYWYRSGVNQTMCQALADITEKAENLIDLTPGDSVLDIGCNDGTLLASYKREGIYRIGFDPAENMAEYSRNVTEHLEVGYFEAETFLSNSALAQHRPMVITSIAMFYDLEDPCKFVSDVKTVLDPEGLWIVQMSYLPSMLKQNEIGNICHEHLEYYSVQSFEYLLDLYDFEIVDLELNAINGGSFRAYIRNRSADPAKFGDATYRRLAVDRVQQIRDEEVRLGLNTPEPYMDFAFRVNRIKADVVQFIQDRVSAGERVYIYGASTKGNTLLQYFGLDHSHLTAASERNPEKWGRVTVGTHIPIVSEEEARRANPEFFLVLPWHFLDEFMAREDDYLKSGGRFIVPMPYFALV